MLKLALLAGVALALPTQVKDCGEYEKNVGANRECVNQGSGCVGAGWLSKDNTQNPNQRVNAVQLCKDQGYTGADPNAFGGNWGHQCRYPGTGNNPNKAGGQLDSFGFTVTWKCTGTVSQTDPPQPTVYSLPDPVVDCGKYMTEKTVWECENKGDGCVGEGWFSKDNVSNPNQRVNAVAICRGMGFTGADAGKFGGNWGDQCRFPGTNQAPNKAGGNLTQFGYTVTWKCTGSRPSPFPAMVPTPKPTHDSEYDDGYPPLPEHVIDCGNYDERHEGIDKEEDKECHGQGAGCVGDHWYSKESMNHRVDADDICKDQGYVGVDDVEWGGNWGHLCRYPGSTKGSPNKAGGATTNFGYTVTWKCKFPRRPPGVTTNHPTPAPTPVVTEEPGQWWLPSPVVYCGSPGYYTTRETKECQGKGAGCVAANEGWFSKDNTTNPNQRVNAQEICLKNGFGNMDPVRFGGNWGHQCRHPGTSPQQHNKAGGTMTSFGFTVTWKCLPKGQQTNPPTISDVVVNCGDYKELGEDRECHGQGQGCVETGWYSKDNTTGNQSRVDAVAICKKEGFDGVDSKNYGGNWGHQCRYPGTSKTSTNKAGGLLTQFGYTVTWRCIKGTEPPVVVPTHAPTMPKDVMDVVVDCGEYAKNEVKECTGKGDGCVGKGWFSKDNTVNPHQRVNAQAICTNAGCTGVGHFGGNWGHQCRFPGTNKTPNKAGGQLTSFGFTVSWQCTGCDDVDDTCKEYNTLEENKQEACNNDLECVYNKKVMCTSTCSGQGDFDGKEMCTPLGMDDCKAKKGICKWKKKKASCAAKIKCKKLKDLDMCCNAKACRIGAKKCEDDK